MWLLLLVFSLVVTAQDDETETPCILHTKEQGLCTPLALCTGFFPFKEDSDVCSSSGSTFVCCPKLPENVGTLAFATPTFSVSPSEEVSNVTIEDVEQLLSSRTALVGAPSPKAPLPPAGDYQDDYPIYEEIDDLLNTPEAFHNRFNKPRKPAQTVDDAAMVLLGVTNDIQVEKGLSGEQAGLGLRSFDFTTSSSIASECPWSEALKCDTERQGSVDTIYRRADGSCNNLKEPYYGRSTTPFQRLANPKYAAGSIQAPRKSVVGEPLDAPDFFYDLPSARTVSLEVTEKVKLGNRDEDPKPSALDKRHTVLVMQFGQFVDHDITHTPHHGIDCCNRDGTYPDSYDVDRCFPIRMSENDPFWKNKGKTCMSLPRSLAAPDLKCRLEYRQQMNQLTHWLDASQIYGNNDHETSQLRLFEKGLLKTTNQKDSSKDALPTCSEHFRPHAKDLPEACESCQNCYFAGDLRANEQINLLTMHTIWMREHNRVAKYLGDKNPDWSDTIIFEEARRVVIAEYQHILYKEWLPILLGPSLMSSYGLWPAARGYSKSYNDNFDPRITNEFAAAAFRLHSLIPNTFNRYRDIAPLKKRQAERVIFPSSSIAKFKMLLKEVFDSPDILRSSSSMVDELAEGMTRQSGHKWDDKFVEDITNHLFEHNKDVGGLDLIALNIQRGRDHGLPGYNSYRELCNKRKATKWSDLADVMSNKNIEKIRKIYRDVDDVDLFVGGFLERIDRDAILGPTLKCIIGDTFARLKYGDRFFYDLDKSGPNMDREVEKTRRFIPSQLREIRKASMARIFCDNTELLSQVQPQVFNKVGIPFANNLTPCYSRDIPRINLDAFININTDDSEYDGAPL